MAEKDALEWNYDLLNRNISSGPAALDSAAEQSVPDISRTGKAGRPVIQRARNMASIFF